ncbi:ImmA/IrrE family metallo-endopeptidase [Rhodomicrobium vannielii ATCC 17100]|uniref:helix-turn-helix domain-containing protein n=1 Tax=Rhodomicrobium vannielii TaxID=1069 RepID=UPI00191B2E62|nr:XRE family transcriptional regulator [Rhodomicrobium vannielii]MBJ7534577.1 ImmA/IrrE family metallo-endopeptidase [Rhodomicrobium vannielii ATCC 17100]
MTTNTPGFVGARLTEARLASALSATQLAEAVGLSPQSISKYENGHQSPQLETLHALARALGVPPTFFLKPTFDARGEPVFWRGSLSAPASMKARAGIRLIWMKEIVDYLSGFFDFPPLHIPRIDVPAIDRVGLDFVEEAAKETRRSWGIAAGPIADVIEKLETNGVLVSRIHVLVEKLDAFSQWPERFGIPFMVLSRDKASACRQRFDSLHELGHMVLHRGIDPRRIEDRSTYNLLERQAHLFACAMLLPEKDFLEELYSPSLDGFLALKERWGTSVAAMIVRCKELDLLDEDQAKTMWINYNRRGWRKGEPLDGKIEKERPRLIRRSFEMLLEEKVQSVADIKRALPFPVSDLEELTDLEPGTLGGVVEEKSGPVFKPQFRADAPSNVISIGNARRK